MISLKLNLASKDKLQKPERSSSPSVKSEPSGRELLKPPLLTSLVIQTVCRLTPKNLIVLIGPHASL